MGIKSIFETQTHSYPKYIKPHNQVNQPAEVLRNPPKLSSFLLGFAGTLLTGLAILREKKQVLIKTEKSEKN